MQQPNLPRCVFYFNDCCVELSTCKNHTQHLEMEARKREAAAVAEFDEPEEIDIMGDSMGTMPSIDPGALAPQTGYDPNSAYAAYGVDYGSMYQSGYSTTPGYPTAGYPGYNSNPAAMYPEAGYGNYGYNMAPGAPLAVPPAPAPVTPPPTAADSGDVEFF